MSAPKVSVLMSVLNGEAYLAEAMDSILAQTFEDFEFLIVDNASTDGTAAIIASYSDQRVRCIRNDETLNLSQSLNKGLAGARGDYVARLDADDIALPERLEKQVRFLDGNPGVALVASAAMEFGGGVDFPGRPGLVPPAEHEALMAALSEASILAHSSIMFRRREVTEIGGYPQDFAYCMDYLLYFRLARHHRLAALPEQLVSVRAHPGQITALPSWRLRRELEAVSAFTEVLSYEQLPDAVRRGLIRYRALTSMRVAANYLRAFRPHLAVAWLGRALATAGPVTFLRVGWNTIINRLSPT